jgi:hypothetical protein
VALVIVAVAASVTILMESPSDPSCHGANSMSKLCVICKRDCPAPAAKPSVNERTEGKLVILRGVLEENYLDKFFTTSVSGQDPTKLIDGTVAYAVLGFADTVAEAQMYLYGRTYN